MYEYSSQLSGQPFGQPSISKQSDLFSNISTINQTIGYNFPVDAVVTFRGEFLDLNNEREGYNYEIKYCLRSISKNLPWIRNIYVMQNPQAKIPSFFSENYRENGVILLSDDQVIPKKYLPTTNSESIETFLAMIPGLSEQFIYFCDDIFVNKPTPIEYFFTKTGIPKRLIFSRMYHGQKQLTNKYGFKAPPSPGFWVWYPHVPIPYTKTEINNFLNAYPEFIEYIRSIRSRKDKKTWFDSCVDIGLTFPCMQFHTNVDWFTSQNQNVESAGESGDQALDYIFFPQDTWKIRDSLKRFICVGDHFTGSLAERSIERDKLKGALESIFPEKSRAEI